MFTAMVKGQSWWQVLLLDVVNLESPWEVANPKRLVSRGTAAGALMLIKGEAGSTTSLLYLSF